MDKSFSSKDALVLVFEEVQQAQACLCELELTFVATLPNDEVNGGDNFKLEMLFLNVDVV